MLTKAQDIFKQQTGRPANLVEVHFLQEVQELFTVDAKYLANMWDPDHIKCFKWFWNSRTQSTLPP